MTSLAAQIPSRHPMAVVERVGGKTMVATADDVLQVFVDEREEPSEVGERILELSDGTRTVRQIAQEVKAGKRDKFWEWIDKAKERTTCTLGLSVGDLPQGAPDTAVLRLEQGVCTGLAVRRRREVEPELTYLLVGSADDWREILAGFDAGKAVMYRKLRLERGEPLEFFRSAYYWTESLACLQRLGAELRA